ncbi:MAG: acetyl-CoA carboxylase biotin carboxyl carrier protein [Planctomycetota bacterium]
MNIKEIKQMVKLMVECDLSELEITDGEHNRVHLKRGPGEQPIVMAAPQPQAMSASAGPAPAQQAAPAATEAAAPTPADNLIEVISPMVGTFYSAPSPDSDPFVSSGDKVTPETVVCIVEAMKVMNEIKAEVAGTIVEVCVQNAQPVEYGQVLFRVKP